MSSNSADFRNVGRIRSALANAAIYRSLSQIAGAATYVLLVRIMSEYDYGIYNLFYSLPAVIGAVLSLGIGNALHRFLPEYFSGSRFGLARHFVSWSLRIRLLTTAGFLLLCLLLWEQIAPVFEVEHLKSYFLIFIGITITHFQCRILTLALGANLLQQWSSGLTTGFALLKLIGYFAATFFGASLEIILVVDLVAYLLWYIGLRFAYNTRIPRPPKGEAARFTREEKRRVFRYAAFYNFNDVGVAALRSTPDRLFIAAFLNPVAVGAYAFCNGLNAMIQKLTPVAFFNGVIEPLIFTLDYNKQKNRARTYFQFLVKINYLVQFPILAVIAAVPAEIISVIFAGKFIEYQYLLVAAFAFAALHRFETPTAMLAQLGEKAGIILASKIFAVYNMVAIVALIPLLGVYGAMIATGTARVFKTLFIWYFVRDIASFKGTGLFFAGQIALWTGCYFCIEFLTGEMEALWALVTAAGVAGLFSLAAIRAAHFNDQESNLIRKASGERASKFLQAAGIIRTIA